MGLLPLFDPPRDDSTSTIDTACGMSLDVRMVMGDHVAIAKETARRLHLSPAIVVASKVFAESGAGKATVTVELVEGFAQVFPEHKFKIVRELQANGHIVGMTGDGVNDAPALKQADCGIAVSGATDAARAAADLVLTAPGLSVITRAIEEARRIFERMTSYAVFRIAETIRVLLFMTLSIMVFNFYPVTAVMIVLLAILNDFPIMTIAYDNYDNAPVAEKPVRWDMHRVLTISTVLGILGVISSFLLFWIVEQYLRLPLATVQTAIFLKLLVAGHLTIYLTRNVFRPHLGSAVAKLASDRCYRIDTGARDPGGGLRMVGRADWMDLRTGHLGLRADLVPFQRRREDRRNENQSAQTVPLVLLGAYPMDHRDRGILSAAVRHWEDFVIISLMLLINAGVGFWEEFKADNAIEALKQNLALRSRVLRDGRWREVEAKTLVRGTSCSSTRQHRSG